MNLGVCQGHSSIASFFFYTNKCVSEPSTIAEFLLAANVTRLVYYSLVCNGVYM